MNSFDDFVKFSWGDNTVCYQQLLENFVSDNEIKPMISRLNEVSVSLSRQLRSIN